MPEGFRGNDLVYAGLWYTDEFMDRLLTMSPEESLAFELDRQPACAQISLVDGEVGIYIPAGCEIPPRMLPGGIPFDEGQALACQMNPQR
ncbi:MAG: hypothetical protein FWD83_08055 [Promicromonosporaceae bacterium]|nr:hypothetical protein [Promicromonosporaceae bacterium]